MTLVVTPRQLAQRAELYHQLSQLLDAGIGLPQALEIQHRNPPSASFHEPLSRLTRSLSDGFTFGEAVQNVGRWLPSFDIALLQAGEKSGRLPNCFKLLSEYYSERSRLARQVISDLMYPVFLFHFALFIGPFPDLFLNGNLLSYLGKTFGVLLPIYALVIGSIYAGQGQHGENWRAFLEKILRRIPILGSARQSLALARLSASLEALINAGVSILEAWELAAAASGSPLLRRTVARWKPLLRGGQTPAETLRESPEFPELFANLYHTGEISGKLDDTLRRLHLLYQEEATRKLRALAQWMPKFVYFGIMLMIAYRVVSFYAGYFGKINDAINF